MFQGAEGVTESSTVSDSALDMNITLLMTHTTPHIPIKELGRRHRCPTPQHLVAVDRSAYVARFSRGRSALRHDRGGRGAERIACTQVRRLQRPLDGEVGIRLGFNDSIVHRTGAP